MWVGPLLDEDLVSRRIRVPERDVVYIKGIFEASEGVGAVFSEPRSTRKNAFGGFLVIAAPRSRSAELRQLLQDLRDELGHAFVDEDVEA